MRAGFALTLFLLTHLVGLTQAKFDVYFICIGSAHYKNNPAVTHYRDLPQALTSAGIMADCLRQFGKARGAVFLSTKGNLFSHTALRSPAIVRLSAPPKPSSRCVKKASSYRNLAGSYWNLQRKTRPGCPFRAISFSSTAAVTANETTPSTRARSKQTGGGDGMKIHVLFDRAVSAAKSIYHYSESKADPIVYATAETEPAGVMPFPSIRFWLPSMYGAGDIGGLCRRTLLLLNKRMGKDDSGIDLETFVSELLLPDLDPDPHSQLPSTPYTTGRASNDLFLSAVHPPPPGFSPAQVPVHDLLGKWTGTHYFGLRNPLFPKSYGGISSTPLPYDSTHITLSIDGIQGSRFSATVYEYFEPDSAHNNYLATMEGSIQNGTFAVQHVHRIAGNLYKYPGYHWIDVLRPTGLSRSLTDYTMVGTTSAPCLYGGPFKVHKAAPPVAVARRQCPRQPQLERHPPYVRMGPAKSTQSSTDDGLQDSDKQSPGQTPRLPPPNPELARPTLKTYTLVVNSSYLRLKFYDDGEIDGDSITVYVNKVRTLRNQRLTDSPIYVPLNLDSLGGRARITMVADNEGSIPPNTALMTFDDGPEQKRLWITSTTEKNAVIEILKHKP